MTVFKYFATYGQNRHNYHQKQTREYRDAEVAHRKPSKAQWVIRNSSYYKPTNIDKGIERVAI